MTEKAKQRRCENDLYVAGMGVVIFGAWDVTKVLIQVFLGADGITSIITGKDPSEQMESWIVVVILMAVLSILTLVIHFYIGLNAQRAARGRDHKKGYYVATIIIMVISVLGMATYWEPLHDIDNLDTTIASIFADLMEIYIYFIIIRSTRALRKSTVNE